ncbi:S9 family peptidase [Pseudonocardia phyllosphaerae]|uniref:S9 family peptidase n=1 Tax=Pseudonocardia phyllosphaerae TaxID=3390502 RepID=UPI00397AB55F
MREVSDGVDDPMADRLRLADQLLPRHRSSLVDGLVETAVWLRDPPRLAYRTSAAPQGSLTVLDPADGERRPATDTEEREAHRLLVPEQFRRTSPDGADTLGRNGDDLVLDDADGSRRVLTTDGTPEARYGAPRAPGQIDGLSERTIAIWSDDGSMVVTQRLRTEGVAQRRVTDSAPADGGPPQELVFHEAYAGDPYVPHAELLVVHAATGRVVEPDVPGLPSTHTTPLARGDVWWQPDGQYVYALHSSRDWRTLRLFAIDPATGASRVLATETGRRVRPADQFHTPAVVRVLADDAGEPSQVLWFSERDGWGHLYLYDAVTGECLRRITSGEIVTQAILRVDAASRTAWISVSGLCATDPYRRTVCRVSLDGAPGGEPLVPLVDPDLDHAHPGLPRRGDDLPGFIDVASTVSDPPVTTVRGWDGAELATVAEADVSQLVALGWTPPERFRALGADGRTTIHGTLHFPPHFDAGRRWPVLDHLYPGPQVFRAAPWFAADEVEPFTALGLVGVTIDGRGTPGRGRAFHDASFSALAGAGLDDHAAVLRTLAAERPYLDLDRAGVYGHSAGGYAAAMAMAWFPELYRAGILASGRYDGRLVMAMILEAYDHPDDPASWARADAVRYAPLITGDVLVVHGESDTQVTMHHAWRLIDALMGADRDVDMLLVPGSDHVLARRHREYVERREWRWLYRHLVEVGS